MTASHPDYESLFASTTPPKPDAVNPLSLRFKYDFAIAFADGDTFPVRRSSTGFAEGVR